MYKLCDTKMRAAVVFLDFTEDSENISRLLEECFSSGREYVYYNRKDSETLLNSGSIAKELEERKKRNLLDVPQKRFIFAFYLELFKTNKARIAAIHNLMRDFSENLCPKNASQIGYLICYRQNWEKESMLTAEDLQESIHENVPITVHGEYLLYGALFDSYQMQETALVRYLHMLSRDTNITKAALSNESGYLCAFAFERYDEEEAENNDKQIQEYKNWLEKEQDKWRDELCNKIVGHAKELIKGYFELEGNFAYLQKLFPRKASDYKRIFLFWHRLDSTSAPHIEEEKRKYETEYLEHLEQRADWNELRDWIRRNITYLDFKKVMNMDTRKDLMVHLEEMLLNEYKDLEYQNELKQKIIELYETKITESLNRLEGWRKEVIKTLHKKQDEAKLNGQYTDLTDCLKNIKKNICYSIPPAIVQQGHMEWLLSKEKIPDNYIQNSGIDIDIYQYPDLRPWKIQMLSIARYSPEDNLIVQILKKGKENEKQDFE